MLQGLGVRRDAPEQRGIVERLNISHTYT